jgi:WS/DGAT/MGAT family acyltransferase
MAGGDAMLWHFERLESSPHTLKTVILDPAGLGRQITLDDLFRIFEPRLGLLPRTTQTVFSVPGFPGRPFWVPARHFDLSDHLDETTLPEPGGAGELDALHSHLVAKPMKLEQPLWSATLVHGLQGGLQAIIFRVHHALADGLGALNSFLHVTTDEPAAVVPAMRSSHAPPASLVALRWRVMHELPSLVTDLGPLLKDALRSYRRARDYRRRHPDLPRLQGTSRNFINQHPGPERVCASHQIDLARMRDVARASKVTINGLYHALIASALREELLARGEDIVSPAVAGFAVAIDPADRTRVHGNHVTPTMVNVFSNIADPLVRLRETARSCREGVELRQLTGVEMAGRWSRYTCRLAPLLVELAAERAEQVAVHVTTANVPGPPRMRYAGPVAVVDWISFVFTTHPSNLNLTAYSYAGHFSIGLTSSPKVLPEPGRFLERMDSELAALENLLGIRRATSQAPQPATIAAPAQP